jgi:hypothetical protein
VRFAPPQAFAEEFAGFLPMRLMAGFHFNPETILPYH